MKKTDAIKIVDKLRPSTSATTASDSVVYLDGDAKSLSYFSTLGFLKAGGLDFNIASGSYDLTQISNLFKILKEDSGVEIDKGCKVGKIKVKLDTREEVEVYDAVKNTTGETYFLNVKDFSKVLSASKNFMQKNNSISRLIVENGEAVAFDGARVFKTTLVECETGSEEADPAMLELKGLNFECLPETIEPMLLFLSSLEVDEVALELNERQITLVAEDSKLVIFTCEFGKFTTVEKVKPLFSPGEFYVMNAKKANIVENVDNMLAMDLSKNSITCFNCKHNVMHSLDTKVEIALDLELKSDFQIVTKYLKQVLSVFEDGEEVEFCVYDKCLIARTAFNKEVLVMFVITR